MQKTTEQFYLLCFFFWILKALFEKNPLPHHWHSPNTKVSNLIYFRSFQEIPVVVFRGISAPKEIPKIEKNHGIHIIFTQPWGLLKVRLFGSFLLLVGNLL